MKKLKNVVTLFLCLLIIISNFSFPVKAVSYNYQGYGNQHYEDFGSPIVSIWLNVSDYFLRLYSSSVLDNEINMEDIRVLETEGLQQYIFQKVIDNGMWMEDLTKALVQKKFIEVDEAALFSKQPEEIVATLKSKLMDVSPERKDELTEFLLNTAAKYLDQKTHDVYMDKIMSFTPLGKVYSVFKTSEYAFTDLENAIAEAYIDVPEAIKTHIDALDDAKDRVEQNQKEILEIGLSHRGTDLPYPEKALSMLDDYTTYRRMISDTRKEAKGFFFSLVWGKQKKALLKACDALEAKLEYTPSARDLYNLARYGQGASGESNQEATSSPASNAESNLMISSANYPSSLSIGDYYNLKGNISSNYNITSVTVGVQKDGQWQDVATKTVSPNKRTFSVVDVDKSISFNLLPAGTYHYIIVAADEKQSLTLLDKEFTVYGTSSSASSSQPSDKPQDNKGESNLMISSANYPSSLRIGDYYDLVGNISSNYNITSVTVGVQKDGQWQDVATKTVSPNKKAFSVVDVDRSISFNLLPAGTYHYIIVATDEKQSLTLLDKEFTITEAGSTLSISGANYPSILRIGDYYDLVGNISSNYNITSVTVGVQKDGQWQDIATKTVSPNKKTFSVVDVDRSISFNLLPAGTYHYIIVATDERQSLILLDKEFTITEASSTLSISGANYPSSLYVGNYYDLKGNISSNYNITSVTVGVQKDGQWQDVATKTVSPNKKTFSVVDVDRSISFNLLPAGTYHYIIVATDEKQSLVLLDKEFTVR